MTTIPSRPAPQVATPGPWSAMRSDPSRGADVWHITACPAPNQEKDICDVPGGPHQEANASLIAAAPELGSALEELLACLMEGVLLGGPNVPILREQQAKIRAMQALLKAGVSFGASKTATSGDRL